MRPVCFTSPGGGGCLRAFGGFHRGGRSAGGVAARASAVFGDAETFGVFVCDKPDLSPRWNQLDQIVQRLFELPVSLKNCCIGTKALQAEHLIWASRFERERERERERLSSQDLSKQIRRRCLPRPHMIHLAAPHTESVVQAKPARSDLLLMKIQTFDAFVGDCLLEFASRLDMLGGHIPVSLSLSVRALP